MKRYLPILIIFIFGFVQAANLVISFLNHKNALTEILIENQETEKSTEDSESCKYFSFLYPAEWTPLGFQYIKKRNSFIDVMASQMFLTKPETPPPNVA